LTFVAFLAIVNWAGESRRAAAEERRLPLGHGVGSVIQFAFMLW
jgi:hypothetical protein